MPVCLLLWGLQLFKPLLIWGLLLHWLWANSRLQMAQWLARPVPPTLPHIWQQSPASATLVSRGWMAGPARSASQASTSHLRARVAAPLAQLEPTRLRSRPLPLQPALLALVQPLRPRQAPQCPIAVARPAIPARIVLPVRLPSTNPPQVRSELGSYLVLFWYHLFLSDITGFDAHVFCVSPSALALQCKRIDALQSKRIDCPCRAVFTGSSACIDCPGNSNSMPGTSFKSSCMCKPGYSGAATSTQGCQSCDAGKYKPRAGAKSCTHCSTGTYSPNTSATAANTCVPCRDFSTSPAASDSAASCNCNAGYTDSIAANYACSACVAGKYKRSLGSNACDLCVQGKYGVNTAATSSGAHRHNVLNTDMLNNVNAHGACACIYN